MGRSVTSRRTAGILATVAIVAGAVAAGRPLWRRWMEFRLDPLIRLEDTLIDLSTAFDHAAVVRENASDPVRGGGLQPNSNFNVDGGYRLAIVAPPSSLVRFRIHVPPDAAFAFGVGVDGVEKRDRTLAGIRFTATVDGGRSFSRVLNPGATGRDRRWVDARIDLARWANRDVEVALATEAEGDGRLAGTPGWSHVRLVRSATRPRMAASADAPNVVVVLIDTLRADELGCYGAEPSSTPNLDRFAADGLVFDHMFSQAPWTMPSVATLFTGLYPRSHGVDRWPFFRGDADDGAERAFLSDTLPTLAGTAQRAGITTVAVSGNPLVSLSTNFARGFDTFVEWRLETGHGRWPSAAEINDAFLRWLRRNRGYRFLAYLHYIDPHSPYTPSPPYRVPAPPEVRSAVASGELLDLAGKINWAGAPLLTAVEAAYLHALYRGEIRYWDAQFATLLGGLDGLALRDRTRIVVVADHGEEFQEHGRLEHGPHVYDETVHVPLIVAGPGVSRGRVDDPVQGVDFFPTVAALLGIAPPRDLPGRDVVAAPPGERSIVSETPHGIAADGAATALVSIRRGGWKLIRSPDHGVDELYDLGTDPGEHRNRIDSAPEAAQLRTVLDACAANVPPPPPPAGHDPRLREKLRALGYAE
jgi:arylsulfatase A-like enzyme